LERIRIQRLPKRLATAGAGVTATAATRNRQRTEGQTD
jgi:hypothetical protein